ncbi:MAG: energy transducer TonB [Pseudomonadales bacterium]|nr:energy transducer TonB [Pseudomonadales bacterium]
MATAARAGVKDDGDGEGYNVATPDEDSPMRRSTGFLIASLLLLSACATSDRPLQLISGAEIDYPTEARDKGIEGSVVVGYDVDDSGAVRNAHVVSAEPPGVFDRAAVATVSSWRFNPRVVDGKPVAATGLTSELKFQLGGADRYADY